MSVFISSPQGDTESQPKERDESSKSLIPSPRVVQARNFLKPSVWQALVSAAANANPSPGGNVKDLRNSKRFLGLLRSGQYKNGRGSGMYCSPELNGEGATSATTSAPGGRLVTGISLKIFAVLYSFSPPKTGSLGYGLWQGQQNE